jgi:uncharacterized membrane protein
MIDLKCVHYPLTETLSNIFKHHVYPVSEWSGRFVKALQNIPQQMQSNPHVAIAVFTITNLALCMLLNLLTNHLHQRIVNCPKKLNEKEKKFNKILIDGVVVGTVIVLWNITFSKFTQYPLNKWTLAAITVTAVFARILINQSCQWIKNQMINSPYANKDLSLLPQLHI